MVAINQINAATVILSTAPHLCLKLYYIKQSQAQFQRTTHCLQLAQKHDIAVENATPAQWQQLLDMHQLTASQNVVLLCQNPPIYHLEWLTKMLNTKTNPLVLILEEINDPRNFGACLRTASTANVDAVIIKKDRNAKLQQTVHNTSTGASFTVPIVMVNNLSRVLQLCREQKLWIIGLTDSAEQTLYDCELTGAIAIIIGSEGKGMRRLTSEQCDFLCRIPMQGPVPCLNVSVATGITLFEAMRQRMQ